VRTILRDPHALRFYRLDWLPREVLARTHAMAVLFVWAAAG
jgi:hypothetical protein